MEYKRPRLGGLSIDPARTNREATQSRMLSRNAGSSIVRTLEEQTQERIDQKIEAIRDNARRKIADIVAEATTRMDAVHAQDKTAKRQAREAKAKR